MIPIMVDLAHSANHFVALGRALVTGAFGAALLASSACGEGKDDVDSSTTTNASRGDETLGDDDWADKGDEDRGDDSDDWADEGKADEGVSEEDLEARACLGCWKDALDAEVCETEYDACIDSLACAQLLECPYDCGNTPECVAECMAIIPSGVEAMSAVVGCMVCDAGPCAADCQVPAMTAYCE